MMFADLPSRRELADAFDRHRPDAPEVDDELLAAFVETGNESLPPDDQRRVLEAVAVDPELAMIVSDAAMELPETASVLPFNGRSMLRLAWAACLLAAVGVTLLEFTSSGASEGEPLKLLDATSIVPGDSGLPSVLDPEDPFNPYVLFLTWVVVAMLTIPAWWPGVMSDPLESKRARS